MNIKNNTVLITGGTSGLGLEFAKQLLALGNIVIITGRNKERLEQTKKLFPSIHFFQSDVSRTEDIKTLYKNIVTQFPALNILINNAGEMRKINLNDTANDLTTIGDEIDINLLGPIRTIQQFLPHLKSQPSAAIVNVTSGLALIPFPVSPVYGASKSGLRSYTLSLRVQLKHTNIKVFELLAPGAKTPLNDKFQGDIDSKTLMSADKLISTAINKIEKNQYEIYPGAAKVIKVLSKIAPDFLLKQLSKPVDKMLDK